MKLIPGTDEQLARVLSESIQVWGHGFDLPGYLTFHQRLRSHPWSLTHYRHMVLLDDNHRILSSCKIYDLPGRVLTCQVRIAGIGAVFTPPAMRGKNFASLMMERIIPLLRDEGFDLAMLLSDITPAFYARFGFVEIEKRDITFDIKTNPAPARPVREAENKVPDQVIDLYQAQTREPFGILRSNEYWNLAFFKKNMHHRLQKNIVWEEDLLYCEDGSAYMWTLWNGDMIQIRDLAYISLESLTDIFSELHRRYGPQAGNKVFGWLPQWFDDLPFITYKIRTRRGTCILMLNDLTGKNQDLLQLQPEEIQLWALDYF